MHTRTTAPRTRMLTHARAHTHRVHPAVDGPSVQDARSTRGLASVYSCADVCTRDPPFVARPCSFMTDVDAWAELTEMYLHLHMYKKASFCYESVVLKSHRRRLAAGLLAQRAYALYTPVGRLIRFVAGCTYPPARWDNGRASGCHTFRTLRRCPQHTALPYCAAASDDAHVGAASDSRDETAAVAERPRSDRS